MEWICTLVGPWFGGSRPSKVAGLSGESVETDGHPVVLGRQDERITGVLSMTAERLVFVASPNEVLETPMERIAWIDASDAQAISVTLWEQKIRLNFASEQARDLVLDLLRNHLASRSMAIMSSVQGQSF